MIPIHVSVADVLFQRIEARRLGRLWQPWPDCPSGGFHRLQSPRLGYNNECFRFANDSVFHPPHALDCIVRVQQHCCCCCCCLLVFSARVTVPFAWWWCSPQTQRPFSDPHFCFHPILYSPASIPPSHTTVEQFSRRRIVDTHNRESDEWIFLGIWRG